MKTLYPGTRVNLFDHLLFKNDKTTPLSETVKPATVVCWRGQLIHHYGNDLTLGPYPNIVDVQFDHWPKGRISHGHILQE